MLPHDANELKMTRGFYLENRYLSEDKYRPSDYALRHDNVHAFGYPSFSFRRIPHFSLIYKIKPNPSTVQPQRSR